MFYSTVTLYKSLHEVQYSKNTRTNANRIGTDDAFSEKAFIIFCFINIATYNINLKSLKLDTLH